MKKQFLLKSMMLLCMLFVGMGAWAETRTVSIIPNSGTNSGTDQSRTFYIAGNSETKVTNASGDDILTWSTIKNSGSGVAYYSAGHWRMYYNSTKGTSIKLACADGVTITKVVLTGIQNYTPTTKYYVDGGSATSGSWSSQKMTISNLNATTSFEFANCHTSNTQLRISQIDVTYEVESGNSTPGISAENTLNIPYTEGNGTFDVTWTGMEDVDVNLYNDAECTSEFTGSWFQADLDKDNNIYYVTEENTNNSSRTVYMQLYGIDSELNDYYHVVTVTQAAAPNKYAVTIVAPENGTLAVTCEGEDIVSGNEYTVGQNINIVATPASGYKFRNIQVVDGSTHTYTASNEKVWTMGEHEITISANFDEIPFYTVAFSVNGTTVQSDVLEENTDVIAPVVSDINGKKFMGWVKSTVVVDPATAPTYETISTATEDVTYVAVFADIDSPATEEYETLTNDEVASLSASANLAYTTEKQYSGATLSYSIYGYTDGARKWVQLKKDKGVYIKITAPSNITKVDVTITSGQNSSGGIADINKHTDYSGYVGLVTSDCSFSNTSNNIGITNTITSDVASIESDGSASSVYLKVSTGARIWGITTYYGTPETYTNYTTTIPPTTITIGQYGYATFVAPCDLDFSDADVTAYAVTPVLAENKVTLTSVTEVPAGKAIVVKGAQGDHEVPAMASAADFDTALEVSATATAFDTDYTYYYLGQEGGVVGFRPLAEGGSIDAGKCFFKVANGGSAKFLTMSFDNEVDGISNVTTNVENGAVYNLAGQRVNANAKGIVIVNGKKYINK